MDNETQKRILTLETNKNKVNTNFILSLLVIVNKTFVLEVKRKCLNKR